VSDAVTLSGVVKDRSRVDNAIRCLVSDRHRDPSSVERDYLRVVSPLREKLARLREKYEHGAELIHGYERRIDELRNELRALLEESRLRRLVGLCKKMNGMLRNMPKVDLRVAQKLLDREQILSKRYLIQCFEKEIAAIRSLLSGGFERQASKLETAIAAQDKYFGEFCENLLDYDARMDALIAEREQLRLVEKSMRETHEVQKLQEATRTFKTIVEELGPEFVRAVLGQ